MKRLLFVCLVAVSTVVRGEVIPVRAVAHRGLWDDTVAENTVEAIRRAYAAGAECVETDFHEEKDGRMMCYHDMGQVAKVRAKHPDYRMPTLEEVLAVVPKDREIQAEIKKYGPGYAEKFVKAVAAAGLTAKNVTVSSFDHFRRRAVTNLLHRSFVAIPGVRVEFAQAVKPECYRLFQIADLVCTIRFIDEKIRVGEGMTPSEFKFFGGPKEFRHNVLRYGSAHFPSLSAAVSNRDEF